ncbi:dTMP kinase [Candidatus Woesebacteria bacterium]|nr:dTMP kinase [Candidatus Woesebacteria bacterium]
MSAKKTVSKKSGFLISFEGGEGGGKTTQSARLVKRLQESGVQVLALREPGGTVVSEQIREVVLSAKNTSIVDEAEVLLFQAARAQIYRQVVLPALAQGTVVIMDRTRDSSVVYQGIVRGFGVELIEQLNNFSTQQTYPDLTLLLDVPVSIGLERKMSDQELNRLDVEADNFHQQVNSAYRQLAEQDKTGRWLVIDASAPMGVVAERIWQAVQQQLPPHLPTSKN